MNRNNYNFGKNPFAKAFQEFDENAFFQNLHNKVKDKSYFEKYKGFKTTILWLSYLFNLASALTASYAIYWLINWLTGIAFIGYLVAATFLFFLEKIKRKSSTEFWQIFFFKKEFAIGWFGLSIFCLATSLLSSGFGVKEGTEQLSPDTDLIITDSLANDYRSKIALLEAENEEFKKQKNHEGIIYHRIQSSINANKKMIAEYQVQVSSLNLQLKGKNEQLTTEYMQEVKLTAWTLVWLTILMELLFEACIAYVWYYYFRSYIEKLNSKIHENSNALLKDSAKTELEEIKYLIQSLKAELSKSNSKKMNQSTFIPSNPSTPSENGTRTPIGFFSQKKKTGMNTDLTLSGQVCSDVDRQEREVLKDQYTIVHKYAKGGEEKTVHYTMRMVKSRINQYTRELHEAKEKQLNNSVIANREKWLSYWQGKEHELNQKIAIAI